MQFSNKVLLIRPANFGFNEQTAFSNAFQNKVDVSEIRENVLNEFDEMHRQLTNAGIDVLIIEDTADPVKPDAIFPNNWISMHKRGKIVLYPMEAENRRLERRSDIVEQLSEQYDVKEWLDFSINEDFNQFLEGTGSVVFDHKDKTAYAAISSRTDPKLFDELCFALRYKPVAFHAFDDNNKLIYHTNVMMCIGYRFAVVCMDSISDTSEQALVRRSLIAAKREIIEISIDQMKCFAGNMLQLQNHERKKILALSQTAFDALSTQQKNKIKKFTAMLPLSIPTIEKTGGGSVRCMIAENFLPEKNKESL